ncbi:MAG: agmatinase family protein [Eudoraea sp.]|nr:agmatinase family protein [Eudoraea sp.]
MNTISLQGILYDGKSSFLKGAAKAPPVIRKAFNSDSANFYAENGSEISPGIFNDLGDFNILEYFDIEKVTLGNLNKKLPLISLGGDHSITYPILRAIHKIHGPADILHIDAHGDLYDNFQSDKYSHACPFARIMEDGLARRLCQVGIRTLNRHQREQAKKFDVEIVEMKDYHIDKIPTFIGPVYLSLDMDALDPAFAPGVSHQEPGGLTTREVLQIIHSIDAPIVGADIVEYNPDRDINGMTAMVCAKFLKEIAASTLRGQG